MPYVHLTYFDRCEIQFYLERGCSQGKIATQLKRSLSTITRELTRNRCPDGRYRALHAQARYLKRQKAPRQKKMDHAPLRDYVEKQIEEKWSPKTISELLVLDYPDDTRMRISHESLYQYVYADKKKGGELYKGLRQGRKQRRARSGGKCNRGTIPNRVPIEERPAIVDSQGRVGDWEGDTVIGRNHKRPIATFIERKTLYATASFMHDKRAASLNEAAQKAFEEVPQDIRHTLTVDNGKEFAAHQQLADALGMDIYFARPYKSNDRAINENFNGLLRQYLPKGTDFTQISEEYLTQILQKLNNRPRAKLGYRTPTQMLEHIKNVALQL